VPRMWKCPFTDRVAGYERCEERSKEHREECKACKAIPKYYWEILFPEEEVEEEEAEEEPEEETPKETPKPARAPQPQEKDTVKVPEVQPETMNVADTAELQQAIYIKGIHNRLEKPRIEENQKSTQKLKGQQTLTEKRP